MSNDLAIQKVREKLEAIANESEADVDVDEVDANPYLLGRKKSQAEDALAWLEQLD